MKKILISVLCFILLLIVTATEETVGSAIETRAELKQTWRLEDPFEDVVNEHREKVRVEMIQAEKEMMEKLEEAQIEWEIKEAARLKAEAEAEAKAKRVAKAKKKVASQNFDKNQSNITEFKVSFYTALPNENGGHGLMANGESVITARNVVASNYYPIGTKIYLEGWGTMTVKDRGGSHFDDPRRLDILVTRKEGESDSQYKARAMQLGRQTLSGYIVK